jgi:hypothetical protein
VRKLIHFFISLLVTAGSANAVIIAGGDGTGNTNAPAGDQGWSYVGRVAKSGVPTSVTYLGNNWFIAAYHMKALDNPTGVLLNATSYGIIVSTNNWRRLTNTVAGTAADLVMFKVNENVPLSPLTVVSSQPANSTAVTMTGNGLARYPDLKTLVMSGPDETYYHINPSAAAAVKRWGTNTIEADGGMVNSGYGLTDTLLTDFDYVAGEAQGATYDSGGGVFVNGGSSWNLAGIMITVSNLYNISGTNAVMLTGGNAAYAGSVTYFADLSAYRSQITNIMQISDLDGDALPDWWEFKYSNSSTSLVASVDSDGDGFSNLREWEADTNPTNAVSFFKNTGVFTLTNQTFYFTGSTARQYQVFYTTNNLMATNLTWIAAHTNKVRGVGTNSSITVSNMDETVFYRLWVSLP